MQLWMCFASASLSASISHTISNLCSHSVDELHHLPLRFGQWGGGNAGVFLGHTYRQVCFAAASAFGAASNTGIGGDCVQPSLWCCILLLRCILYENKLGRRHSSLLAGTIFFSWASYISFGVEWQLGDVTQFEYDAWHPPDQTSLVLAAYSGRVYLSFYGIYDH